MILQKNKSLLVFITVLPKRCFPKNTKCFALNERLKENERNRFHPPSDPAVKDTSNAVVAVDVARKSCGALAGRKHVPGNIEVISWRQDLQIHIPEN